QPCRGHPPADARGTRARDARSIPRSPPYCATTARDREAGALRRRRRSCFLPCALALAWSSIADRQFLASGRESSMTPATRAEQLYGTPGSAEQDKADRPGGGCGAARGLLLAAQCRQSGVLVSGDHRRLEE